MKVKIVKEHTYLDLTEDVLWVRQAFMALGIDPEDIAYPLGAECTAKRVAKYGFLVDVPGEMGSNWYLAETDVEVVEE